MKVSRALGVAWLVAAGCPCASPSPPPSPRASAATGASPVTALVHVAVLTLQSAEVLRDQTVLVRGDQIERVGAYDALAIPAGARRVEGESRYVMPGLMDMHVHLVREPDLVTMLALGVTTARNMWGAPVHVAWRGAIARGEMLGPTLVTAGPILDGEDPAHDGSYVIRSQADADRAVAAHRQLGYDFVKVYSGLSVPLFDRVLADAAREGLPVAGHVPWAVPLGHAADAGMTSVEHMTGFVAALQAEGSPVAGRVDRASRAQQIEHVDASRIAALVEVLRARRMVQVPTLGVMESWKSAAEVRAILAQPEMRYVPPCDRATWEPGPDDAVELARARRKIALYEQVLAALSKAGAPIATGTDELNPLVVPGFAMHREIERLVEAGLTPLAALQAATVRGAELLGRSGELGGLAPGMRADLLLLDANPLENVQNTRRIAGVMARGRWFSRGELDALLAQVAAELAAPPDPYRGAPPLCVEGAPAFAAEFQVTWRDVPFDVERMAVGRAPNGEESIAAESFDPHVGQTVRVRLRVGADHAVQGVGIESDGAAGRGSVEGRVEGGQLRLHGTALASNATALERALPSDGVIAPERFLSGMLAWRHRLLGLAVGETLTVREQDVALGSEATLVERVLQVRRLADPVAATTPSFPPHVLAFELTPSRGKPATLRIDASGGWPIAMEMPLFGAVLRYQRVVR